MTHPTDSLYKVGWRISDEFVSIERLAGDELEHNPAVLNELQRFELWAINLGLYHSGHSSLDYRLRDSTLVFGYSLDLLHDLERALRQFKDALTEINFPRDDTSLHIGSNDEVLLREEDSDEEDLSSYQMEAPTEALFLNIVSTVDKLYRLAFKIRNPAMRFGLSKATSYSEMDPDTGRDLIKEFAILDIRHAKATISILAEAEGKVWVVKTPPSDQSHFHTTRISTKDANGAISSRNLKTLNSNVA
ncbi:unnamed protein product [Penicillium glandicola]